MKKIERTDRLKRNVAFAPPNVAMSIEQATDLATTAMQHWSAASRADAEAIKATLDSEFPDSHSHSGYWHDGHSEQFRSFFTWGHNHDFGFGVRREGAMQDRHIEIASECLSLGFLPESLGDWKVLDIGCWTGGDLLLLKALGANITAIEEHPKSAAAAQRLCELVGCETEITTASFYRDDPDLAGKFDLIYSSGVIYHVTDPLLFARIAFAYLKPNGRLIIETKSSPGLEPTCGYSGTVEFGWNWYAPTQTTLGRWLIDAGFTENQISLNERDNGRLLACATKLKAAALPESAGFSRPGSWLEELA